MGGQECFDSVLFFRVDCSIHVRRIGDRCAAGVLGDFHAATVEPGKAVEHAGRQLEQIDGEARRRRRIAANRPRTRTATSAARRVRASRSPSSEPAHEPAAMINFAAANSPALVRTRTPRSSADQSWTTVSASSVRPGRLSRREMCRHAIFDEQIAGARFEHADQIARHAQPRPAPFDFARRNLFDCEAVLRGRPQHAGHDDAIGRPDFQAVPLRGTALAGRRLQLPPQSIAFLSSGT